MILRSYLLFCLLLFSFPALGFAQSFPDVLPNDTFLDDNQDNEIDVIETLDGSISSELLKRNMVKGVWPSATGEGVKVAIIGTSLELNHPELRGKSVSPQSGVNMAPRANDPNDTSAAIVALGAANNEFLLAGLAPNARFIPAQGFDRNLGSTAVISEIKRRFDKLAIAIEHANARNADIILVLGALHADFTGSQAQIDGAIENTAGRLKRAVAAAKTANRLIVAPADTGIAPRNGLHFPESFEEILKVAPVTKGGQPQVTIGGNKVDIAGLGDAVLTGAALAAINGVSSYPTNIFGDLFKQFPYVQLVNGRRVAAGSVAGAAAVLKSGDATLTGPQIKRLLMDGASPLPASLNVGVGELRLLNSAEMAGIIIKDPCANPANIFDVNQDGNVSALDALLIINRLNVQGSNSAAPTDSEFCYDVSQDGQVSALDALRVINELNRRDQAQGEGEAAGEPLSENPNALLTSALPAGAEFLAWQRTSCPAGIGSRWLPCDTAHVRENGQRAQYVVQVDRNSRAKIVKAPAYNWRVSDSSPAGAVVTKLFDQEIGGLMVKMQGNRFSNAYDFNKQENIKTVMDFSYKYSEYFSIRIRLNTILGTRYLYFSPTSRDWGKYGSFIYLGLGNDARNGSWKSFTRDLANDLQKFDPTNEIISIGAVTFRGSGRVTEPKFRYSLSGKMYDADKFRASTSVRTDSIVNDTFGKVFEEQSRRYIFLADHIKVDTTKRYQLSGMFKSTGSVNSRIYYAILQYDANGRYLGASYTGAANQNVPKTWKRYASGSISGETRSYSTRAFKSGTKSVRIMLLANYGQNSNSKLRFDKLKFSEVK